VIAPLALLLWLAPLPLDPAPRLAVRAGEARLACAREVRVLDRRSGELTLTQPAVYVESGAASTLELTWRARASVTLTGPAAFELGAEPRLVLDRFRTVELEARRGPLAVEISGFALFELGTGAVRLQASPSGVELLNRGGATLELRTLEGKKLRVQPGRTLRLVPEG